MTRHETIDSHIECASDGTILRDPQRKVLRYKPLRAYHHFRELVKDKEDTTHVFRIFESLPSKDYDRRVHDLTLSEQGDHLRRIEPVLPPLLDDHATLRKLPKGSVAHAYCDFMEREGLSAAGLVAESDKLGRPKYNDLWQWYTERARDTHDLLHILTGYGRDALGEQCVLLFTHGQQPSHGHLLIGYAGALNIRQSTRGSKAPIFKAVRQAHRTGKACPAIVAMPITELLASDLTDVRRKLNIPEPNWYRECHRIWSEEGVDPYNILGQGKSQPDAPKSAAA